MDKSFDINKFIKANVSKGVEHIQTLLKAKKIILSKEAIRSRMYRLGIVVSLEEPKTLQEHIVETNSKVFKQEEKVALKEAIHVIKSLKSEIENILELKKNIFTYKIKASSKVKSEATAIWLASDWHVAEKVTYAQTNGINMYNLAISKARGEQYFKHALSLTKMMGKDVEIKTIVLALLGDFMTGYLHDQAKESNYLPPMFEIQYAQRIILSGINYVLENSEYNIVIPCASGNHGRTTKFSEFGSENGHSLEFLMYSNIADYYRENKRVQVIINEGAHTYLDIYGYKVRFLHGHDIKFGGGVGGITIPVNKAIAQWDKGKKAYITCFGHFHQKFDGGNFIANGSLIGYNSFALSIKASAEPPAQQMFLIDKKRGKTIVAPILFDT